MPQSDDPHRPLNARGRPQYYAWGHRIKGQPQPTQISAIIDEKNRLRRALRALTAGQAALEWAAQQCQDMKMSRPDIAVLHCRKAVFGDRFADLPHCDIERDMIDIGLNAMVVLFTYRTVRRAIERQLHAALMAPDSGSKPAQEPVTAAA